jgi:predicted molibdopterin-dependent oxidoreductase YjgC
VQGGAEVGCVPKIDSQTAARWEALWRFALPQTPGWTTTEMVDHASRGEVDVFWLVGGNFLETLPERDTSAAALRKPRLRVHQDIVVSTSMLVDGDGDVILLPATTRYESPGGGTETSTERRIIFSPEVPGRRIGAAMAEWWVFRELALRLAPSHGRPIGLEDAQSIRHEISQAIPLYAGIESLHRKGDAVQWGGRNLYADGRFATADGKARFARVGLRGREQFFRDVVENPSQPLPQSRFALSTRRGKQFNSMVQRDVDPLTGASRDDILISAEDLGRLGVDEGRRARLRSASGTFTGTLRVAPIKPGNLQVHWPEANVLLGPSIDHDSLEPDYNTLVVIEPL